MSLTYNQKIMDEIKEKEKDWEKDLNEAFSVSPERLERFITVSDKEIKRIYTPTDTRNQDFLRDIGFPGFYPFTNCSASMYGAVSGRCACLPGSIIPATRTFHHLVEQGQTRTLHSLRHASLP
jgi:methylmalonyl-CoA mutase N-terminal domain/subunit